MVQRGQWGYLLQSDKYLNGINVNLNVKNKVFILEKTLNILRTTNSFSGPIILNF